MFLEISKTVVQIFQCNYTHEVVGGRLLSQLYVLGRWKVSFICCDPVTNSPWQPMLVVRATKWIARLGTMTWLWYLDEFDLCSQYLLGLELIIYRHLWYSFNTAIVAYNIIHSYPFICSQVILHWCIKINNTIRAIQEQEFYKAWSSLFHSLNSFDEVRLTNERILSWHCL